MERLDDVSKDARSVGWCKWMWRGKLWVAEKREQYRRLPLRQRIFTEKEEAWQHGKYGSMARERIRDPLQETSYGRLRDIQMSMLFKRL